MSGSDDAVTDPQPRWLLGVLLLVVGAVHLRGWWGTYVYDDLLLVVQNEAVRSDDVATLLAKPLFSGVADYWRPLTMLTLWGGHRLGGALAVHVLAWLLHLAATAFAWCVARRVVDRPAAAFVAALVFGVHPVQVEGVAWCAALNDPLWWALGLWCLDAALRSAHGTMAVAFALALLAKENAIVLAPLVVVVRWWARLPLRASAGWLAAVFAGWWLLRAWVFGAVAGGIGHGADDPVAKAQWPAAALEVFGRQLELLVWPWPMSPFRAFDGGAATLVRAAAWSLAWLATLVVAWRRGRRDAVLASALIGAPIVLAAAFADRLGPYPIADRYLGPAVLGAGLLLVGRAPGRPRLVAAMVVAVVAAVASIQQTRIWLDPARLAERGLEVAPQDPGVLVMAGNVSLDRGDVGLARRHYERALATAAAPGADVRSRIALDAQIGLAWCLLSGSPPQPRVAAAHFERIVEVDPEGAFAWIGLGVAHGMVGDAVRAEQALLRAIELAPDDSRAHGNYANLCYLRGRFGEARAAAQRAVELDPGNTQAAALLQRLAGASNR